MADQGLQLSEWLELMLAEIARRQEEVHAAAVEQAARAATRSLPPLAQQPQSQLTRPHSQGRSTNVA